jgi:hypothetical protein
VKKIIFRQVQVPVGLRVKVLVVEKTLHKLNYLPLPPEKSGELIIYHQILPSCYAFGIVFGHEWIPVPRPG